LGPTAPSGAVVAAKASQRSIADDEEESATKPKRKANRLSASGSDETTGPDTNVKRKKSNSIANKSISSNNETNDETDDDGGGQKESGPGMRSSVTDSDPSEKVSKSGNITFNDLDTDRVVDVKYAYGGKIHNYRAKIIQMNREEQKVFVHYLGWNSRYDEWIKVNRVLRIIEEASSSANKRKRKTSKNKGSGHKETLPIQPEIQPVSSPSQLLTEAKSSPTHKTIALLKSACRSEASSLQRSLSCTSTCSSEQSKEEGCQSKADEVSSVKTGNSDLSISAVSPVSSAYMSKSTDRVESDEQNNKEIECLSNSDELLIRPANAIAPEAGDVGLTALLSIKEELVDAETASTPFDMKLTLPDEHNASFSSADQEEFRKSPRKAAANSRKNSINNNDSLNSSKRSINSSRKNSVDSVRKASTEFNGRAVDISTEIEVSFLEDNEFLSSSNSALVTFDIGKVPLSLEKKSNLLLFFLSGIYFKSQLIFFVKKMPKRRK